MTKCVWQIVYNIDDIKWKRGIFMFLSQLKPKEKELFLDLWIHAANANQVFA